MARAAEPADGAGVFAKQNLVAWCIVPFDAKHRTPEQRAEMLEKLGIRRFAYDWRAEHVPTFSRELDSLEKHGIELFAFWSENEEMFRQLEKRGLKPQIWRTAPSPAARSQDEKVEAAARQLLPLMKRTQAMGCKLGLYNHGGWGGEPRNLVAVCRRLREEPESDHVGIVYNFHHAHEHIGDFAESLAAVKPYLLCLNVNGMNDDAKPKIVSLGEGRHELEMLRTVEASGYTGPIGILDHRPEADAEESLRQNLAGMKKLLEQLGDKAAAATYR